ncbi:hypothetical protein CR513_41454, partial [Mucuna pruriens]
MIDATSGGALMDKTYHQLSATTRVCGICTFVEHLNDMCPTLQETRSDHLESVGSIGRYQYGKQLYLSLQYDSQQFGRQQCWPIPSQRKYLAQKFGSTQSTTIVPTAATTKSAITGQLTIFGGLDEVVGNKQPGVALQQKLRQIDFESESEADLRVEINIPLLDAIKQIPKYAKFLKELSTHKRKNMKGGVEFGGIVSALTKNDKVTAESQQTLPKKCQDPEIFYVPSIIGECTFANAMLDLGASINVMPTLIYKSLNFSGLEPTRMIIQLANKSISRRCTIPSQGADFPSGLLCVGYGGRDIGEMIYLDSWITIFYDC